MKWYTEPCACVFPHSGPVFSIMSPKVAINGIPVRNIRRVDNNKLLAQVVGNNALELWIKQNKEGNGK